MNAQTLSKKSTIRFLALGDSYTIGESVAEDQRWPVQLADRLQTSGYTCEPPKIIAVTGWRTDDLRRAIENERLSDDYDIVSLLIGVNNQYQGKSADDYAREFSELLEVAIQHAGGRKEGVFVLSIPDYGFTPFGQSKQALISQQIDLFNSINRKITTDKGVCYIDITDISREGLADPQLIAADGLHPSGKMYERWVERIVHILILR